MLKLKALCSVVLIGFCMGAFAQSKKPADYVNPFIGTTNYGATNPGAVMPRGMVSVTPFNVAGQVNKHEKDREWNSTPYWNDNTFLTGFTHVNLSGVGCPDLGTILTMPTTGKLNPDGYTYGSAYTDEKASAGYYTNRLTKYGIKTELTATKRAGVSRFHFPKGQANVLLNLGLGLTNVQGGAVRVLSHTEVEGYKMVGRFCYNSPDDTYPVYFVMRVSRPADELGTWKEAESIKTYEKKFQHYGGDLRVKRNNRQYVSGDSIGAFFTYHFDAPQEVVVEVGVSYVSIENARENLETEVGKKSFEQLVAEAKNTWNETLSKIEVEGGSEEDKTIFYTALYHAQLHPNTLNDCNGQYPEVGTGNIGRVEKGETRYTVFSLWDTYRNMHQLMALVYPDQQLKMVHSMLDMYKENGWLPKWELNSTETFTMVGDPATAVIADTYLKGLTQFDTKLAYEAMCKSAETVENNPIRLGNKEYLEKGYIPVDSEDKLWGNVSTTMEYNIADFALAKYAKALGKKEDYKKYFKRSKGYRHFFDKKMKLMHPKMADGSWYEPFNPLAGSNFSKNVGFVEGNSWQYSFMVPHDVKGLIQLMGGKRSFVRQLEEVFARDQFDMANEPDMNYAFLFNHVRGQEWKAQRKVQELIRTYYKNAPDGLPGNDDTGTMSAWLVFSMMGIYPEAPAIPEYSFVVPAFDRVVIHLDPKYYSGKSIEIVKKGKTEKAQVIRSSKWNGSTRRGVFISHDELTKGGTLQLQLKDFVSPTL
ncbi:MAG: GH92 family glycosyl hydrolase [Cytophagales bacterium]|nr:GH92 family glycosyl hydrolase [Cytophagales bacterium]